MAPPRLRALRRPAGPPDFVGTPNQRGELIPDSLYPSFRDDDELPANADLAAGLSRALAHSEYLVVRCRPRSAVSPWVRKEIRVLKEMGKSDPILAVILAGEPNADAVGKARDAILPEAACSPLRKIAWVRRFTK